MMDRRVVVTGMGVISPIGNDLATFWAAIRAGASGVGPITRFDPAGLECRIAAEVKGFAPETYIDPKDAKRMALFTQFAVAAAFQAWHDAGFVAGGAGPDLLRTAVVLGNGIGGNEVDQEAHRRMFERGPGRIPPLTIPKIIVNEAAGNISMTLGIKGRAHSVVTACASGTDALGTALDLLRLGRADVIVSGGTESTISQYGVGGFCALRALSTGFNETPTLASRPFDRRRDGFVMGEGAGVLVLETAEHALRRGARVYAELAGYGGTADACHLTAPDPEGEGAARAMREALRDAGMAPADIDYINAHGTSTEINDPVETKAIKAAFGEHARRLAVSSTKGMTGHCIGAAGGLEAIVSVLALRDQFLPATINLDEPDPLCDLDYVPNVGRQARVRAAMSNSLGFGGHNGVVLLREWRG
jgi:3-oxoacyl-[acyl-carrier-protein] synthase II